MNKNKWNVEIKECERAAEAFAMNDLGKALTHTTIAAIYCIKRNGKIESVAGFEQYNQNVILGQNPNKMIAIGITLMYEACFHLEQDNEEKGFQALQETCMLFNLATLKLKKEISKLATEEEIRGFATNLVVSNYKNIKRTIDDAA